MQIHYISLLPDNVRQARNIAHRALVASGIPIADFSYIPGYKRSNMPTSYSYRADKHTVEMVQLMVRTIADFEQVSHDVFEFWN